MTTYEERLEAFARGKRLRRFRGMIRHPKDPACDACGSVMPSHLLGLRDMETARDYFVGGSCLSALSGMLALERPYVRSDLRLSYEKARGGEADGQSEGAPPARGSHPDEAGAGNGSGEVQVIESGELVTVLVRVASPCGQHQAWGVASEPRHRQVWRQDPGNGLALTESTELNREAVASCLPRAREMALRELEASTNGDQG